MALPLAAIAAAGTTALSIIQRSRIQAGIQRATGALGSITRGRLAGVGGAIVGGGAGGFVASQIVNAGQGNIVPFVPTLKQFQSGLQKTGITTIEIPGFQQRRRYRRMNVCNVKALKRAGRRVEGFVKLAKSLVSMPGARAKHPIKGRRRRR